MRTGGWQTKGFVEAFDRWCELESPEVALRVIVLHWVLTRAVNPYQGVKRLDGFPNLWFAAVPETVRQGTVVTCSYYVSETDREVRCNMFGTLNLPI